MVWLNMVWVGVALIVVLVLSAVNRTGKRAYLQWLDLISYLLTSVTVLMLIIATQGQISQAFSDLTGEDLSIGDARGELNQFLDMQCGEEPECEEVRRAIIVIANPRGPSKTPWRVDTDVSRLPALAAAVNRYNDAFDQNTARNSILFLDVGFWVVVAAMCGVIIGIWRRILTLKDAIGGQKH